MTNPNPRWRPMTGQLPIVGIAPPLKAAFVPSALGTLAIKARSGASLPSGKLVLIATSKSQTAHWLQDGQVQDGVLTVPMEGFEAVAASAPETDWTLTLGQITEKGLITLPPAIQGVGKASARAEPVLPRCPGSDRPAGVPLRPGRPAL